MPGWTAPASRFYASGLLFADRTHLTAAVVAAVRADDVGWLELLTLRAGTKRHRLQRVVRAALGRPRLGVSAFRIRHVSTLRLLSDSQSVFFFKRVRRPASRGSSQRTSHAHVP